MTEHDGLTAEQEAERRFGSYMYDEVSTEFEAFVSGAEWATERETARVEAAEERVAELEAERGMLVGLLRDTAVGIRTDENGAWLHCEVCERDTHVMSGDVLNFSLVSHDQVCPLAAPTTAAVTEVEGD